jgi:hypothetical protein
LRALWPAYCAKRGSLERIHICRFQIVPLTSKLDLDHAGTLEVRELLEGRSPEKHSYCFNLAFTRS